MAKRKNKSGIKGKITSGKVKTKGVASMEFVGTGTPYGTGSSGSENKPTKTTVKYGKNYDIQNATKIDPFTQSQALADAEQRKNNYLDGNRPTYTSKYDDSIKNYVDQIANRKDFSYDFNADPLYQNYKDQYTRQAQMGQQNTMAQAAALTGGYGNSYAATAGSLAYQDSMSKLNDVIPQLYEMAMNKYETDLANKRQDLAMYQSLDDTDYGRYRDTVNDWNTDRDFYTQDYYNKYNQEYGQHRDNVADTQWGDQFRADQYANAKNYTSGEHWNKTNYDYQKSRDKVADKQWNKQFKEDKRQFNLNYKIAKKGSASSGGSGGGRRRYGSSSGSTGISTGIYNSLRKFKNGNSAQREVAFNTINRYVKEGKISKSQGSYLYDNWLGFGGKRVKITETNKNGEIVVKGSRAKYQTRAQAIKAGAPSNTLSKADFIRNMPSDKNLRKYKSYEAYLKAMVKKGKK